MAARHQHDAHKPLPTKPYLDIRTKNDSVACDGCGHGYDSHDEGYKCKVGICNCPEWYEDEHYDPLP